jgi:uncharacterized membrane protein
VKLSYLIRGLPGHPLHPPLTDVTIGTYTFAAVAAFCDVVGISNHAATQGWWLALLFGLISTGLTATAGLIDWFALEWGSPIWRTATLHMLSMIAASVVFVFAVLIGHSNFKRGDVTTGPFILTMVGFGLLTLGGWLGGAIVFVHGMNVLKRPPDPASRTAAPIPRPEEEAAERG